MKLNVLSIKMRGTCRKGKLPFCFSTHFAPFEFQFCGNYFSVSTAARSAGSMAT